MRIDLSMDASRLLGRVRNAEKRLAYAAVNAINATAKRVQQAEFEHVAERFIIRRPQFFFGSPARPGGVAAKISPFASVGRGRIYAEVATGAAAVRGRRRALLPQFETGGTRTPTPPSRVIAVPITGRPARPSIRGPVPPQFTIAGLKLRKYQGAKRLRRRRRGRTVDEGVFGEFGRFTNFTPGKGVQIRGEQRTFLLPSTRGAPEGGIFQRYGPGREAVRMIYAFRKSVPLDDRLRFHAVAVATANAWAREEFEREITATLRRYGVIP